MEIYVNKKGNLTAKTYYKTKKGVSHRAMILEKESRHSTSETNGATLSDAKIPIKKKVDGSRDWEKGIDRSILVHRYYAAVSVEGDEYRAMILTKEHRPSEEGHMITPYTLEV